MALASAQVVDALAALVLGVTALASRVYTSRAWPLDQVPAARVTAEGEDVQAIDLVGQIERHQLEVAVRLYAQAVSDVDTTLHSLAAAALTALMVDPKPHALQLVGISRALQGEGEATLGVITLRLLTTFHVDSAAPETIL